MSASVVAHSGKAEALPWHSFLNFDLIAPYGCILILYLNAVLAVSDPKGIILDSFVKIMVSEEEIGNKKEGGDDWQ